MPTSRDRERILGIDPGSLVTGWGLVQVDGNHLTHIAHGTIATSSAYTQGARLRRIHQGIQEVLSKFRPSGVSLERVFFARNAASALKLGQARGVALLAAAEHEIAVFEYSAAEIKVAVTGFGQATKQQVQKMVTVLLCLRGEVVVDAADALAAAICHIHRREFPARARRGLGTRGKVLRWRDYLEIAAEK
jgi:crossover junction endodeoxyribonuclease RuvC